MSRDWQATTESVEHLRASISKLARRLRSERRVNNLGFTPLIVLGRLARHGPATATEISQRERIQPQSLTRVLALLERKQLIARKSDPADRRRMLIEATQKGRGVLYDDGSERAAWLAYAMNAALTEAEREILLIAGRMMDKLADVPGPADQDQVPDPGI